MLVSLDPVTHTYRADGHLVSLSVTGALREAGLIDFDGVPAAVLETARDRGRRVHAAVALLLRDDLDWDSIDDECRPYVEAAARFVAQSGFVADQAFVERPMYSAKYGVAGTLDAVGRYRGQGRWKLIDWATGDPDDCCKGPQTAGYHLLLIDTAFEDARWVQVDREALQLRRDGTYRVEKYADVADYACFQAAVALAAWKRNHR